MSRREFLFKLAGVGGALGSTAITSHQAVRLYSTSEANVGQSATLCVNFVATAMTIGVVSIALNEGNENNQE